MDEKVQEYRILGQGQGRGRALGQLRNWVEKGTGVDIGKGLRGELVMIKMERCIL